jgi:peptide/nickel transport system substrate-binding protein
MLPFRDAFSRHLIRALAVIVVLASAGSCGTGVGGTTDRNGPVGGTGGEEQALPPQRGGHLVYGIETDPNGLDPTRNALDPVGIQLANALYDPVAAFDASGVARPYLARLIEPVAGSNFMAWRIGLRPGVRFHSGKPLDGPAAKTFVDAIVGEHIDPGTGAPRPSITQDAADYVASSEVVAPDEIVIHMQRPWSTFPALLAGQGGYIISPDQINNPQGHSVPDGTGPFRLRSWQHGKGFNLVRNDDYWRDGLPYLDSVEFAIEPDGNQRISALQRGTFDVLSVGYVSEVKRLDELMASQSGDGPQRLRLDRDPGASESISVMLNTARKPFDSDLVRQAIAYATDVESLARDNGWSPDRVIIGPFEPSSRWYVPTSMPRFDLRKARQLIDEYKIREGVEHVSFELLGAKEPRLLQQLIEQWSRAGIEARISMTDFRSTVPRAVAGMYDAMLFRYFSAVDPDVLYSYWTSETRRGIGELSLNFPRFATESIDEALRRARATTDEAVRRESYATVQHEFARYVPYVWLFRSEWVIARSDRVHNARNVTLPDGTAALPFDTGTHRLTETWVSSGA